MRVPSHGAEAASWQPATTVPVLSPADLHVWRISLLQPAQIVQRLTNYLSIEEQERMSRFVTSELQRRFAVVHGAKRWLLSHYLQCDCAEIVFDKNEYGKPFLLNHPLQFNISHSQDEAVIALHASACVGVDIECKTRQIDLLAIAKRFFSVEEYAALQTAPLKKRHDYFFNIWVRKEAFIKMIGRGLSFSLADFSVAHEDFSNSFVLLVEDKLIDFSAWMTINLPVISGYAGALICAQDCASRQFFWWQA